jgi:glycosyltransferase involved in cell wall biosynthesis
VQDGKNGLLVPPRDPLALADAIRTLLENPLQRKQMGTLGREFAVGEFSEDQIIFQTMAVYNSL